MQRLQTLFSFCNGKRAIDKGFHKIPTTSERTPLGKIMDPQFTDEKTIVDASDTDSLILKSNTDDKKKGVASDSAIEDTDEIITRNDNFVVATDSVISFDKIDTCNYSSADDDEENAIANNVIIDCDFMVEGRIIGSDSDSDTATTTGSSNSAQDELEKIKQELRREKRKRKKERERFIHKQHELKTRVKSAQNKFERHQDEFYRQRREFREDYQRKVDRCLHLEDEKLQRDMFVKQVMKVLNQKSQELRKLTNPLAPCYYGPITDPDLPKYTPRTPLLSTGKDRIGPVSYTHLTLPTICSV